MEYTQAEILQTIAMTEMEHLDIRTVTLSLSLRDCATDSIETTSARVREKIERTAARLVSTVDQIGDEIGIRIANKRIAVTPVSFLTEGARGNPVDLARAIDDAAGKVGVDFVGGYSALVHKGFTRNESDFLDSIPEALASTERLCSSVNAATTRAGINMLEPTIVAASVHRRCALPHSVVAALRVATKVSSQGDLMKFICLSFFLSTANVNGGFPHQLFGWLSSFS